MIMERPALSDSTKYNTMFMECIRRIQNCSPDTPWSDVCKHLSRYMNVMRISGYSQEVRFRICKGAILRHRELCDRIEKGERKYLYRSSEEIRKSKSDSTSWANTWFLKGATRSTISCPVTPGGILKKELTKTVNCNKTPGSV